MQEINIFFPIGCCWDLERIGDSVDSRLNSLKNKKQNRQTKKQKMSLYFNPGRSSAVHLTKSFLMAYGKVIFFLLIVQ